MSDFETDNAESNKAKYSRSGRRGSMTNISTVLSRVIGKFGIEQRMKEHAFMSLWGEIVEHPFKNVSHPLFIDHEGNLVVAVKDSVIAQELSLKRGVLLKNLAPFARGVGLTITGMRFDLKHFRDPGSEESIDFLALSRSPDDRDFRNPNDDELQSIDLTETDLQELANLKSSLESEGNEIKVSERVMRLYERELRLRGWREKNSFIPCSECGFIDSRLYGSARLCRLCHVTSVISTIAQSYIEE